MVFDEEQARDLMLHRGGDKHRSWLGGALDAGGNVGCVAEDFASRVDYDRAAFEADTGGEGREATRGVSRVKVSKGAQDREAGASGTLRIILLRLRIAEQGHDPVAELFQNVAAVLGDRIRGFVEVAPHKLSPVLCVELRREAC